MLRLDIPWGKALAVTVLAMGAESTAERLLERDGIELRGTARVVTYAASKCNVEEASHPEAEYERMKANQGQPLDVWRLDFSVHNGSGKWLDHLIARYGIESKWPDCTNWSGPSGTYSEPVRWSGTVGHIQESGRNVVAPGATLTATTYILAFHEDQPRFERWSVDFTFGVSSDAARIPSAPGPPTATPTGGVPAPRAEERRGPSGTRAERTCAGQAEGAACWKELASHPGCRVWTKHYYVDRTVTWTGMCSGGRARGTGTLKWVLEGMVQEQSGLLQSGKKHGLWVSRLGDAMVAEGPYVDDVRHGQWIIRLLVDGTVSEGPYVDDLEHGQWVHRYGTGNVEEGPYERGKKHGQWVIRRADGDVEEGPYERGKKHGRWVMRFANGEIFSISTYVNDRVTRAEFYRSGKLTETIDY